MFDSSGENNYNFIVLYNRKYFYHLHVFILQGVLLKQINIQMIKIFEKDNVCVFYKKKKLWALI